MAMTSYTLEQAKKLPRLTDKKLLRKIIKDESLIDYSDISPTTDQMAARMVRPGRPRSANPKKLIAVRIDPDIYAAVKRFPGYSARVNDMLRGMLTGAGVL